MCPSLLPTKATPPGVALEARKLPLLLPGRRVDRVEDAGVVGEVDDAAHDDDRGAGSGAERSCPDLGAGLGVEGIEIAVLAGDVEDAIGDRRGGVRAALRLVAPDLNRWTGRPVHRPAAGPRSVAAEHRPVLAGWRRDGGRRLLRGRDRRRAAVAVGEVAEEERDEEQGCGRQVDGQQAARWR
jgi:hypothetical protein